MQLVLHLWAITLAAYLLIKAAGSVCVLGKIVTNRFVPNHRKFRFDPGTLRVADLLIYVGLAMATLFLPLRFQVQYIVLGAIILRAVFRWAVIVANRERCNSVPVGTVP